MSALLAKQPPEEIKDDQRTDFAIGYDWADVRDDADEGLCSFTQDATYINKARPAMQILLHGYPCTLCPRLRPQRHLLVRLMLSLGP